MNHAGVASVNSEDEVGGLASPPTSSGSDAPDERRAPRASLARFVVAKTASGVLLVVAVVVVNFLLIHSAPGDPIDLIAPEQATEEQRAQIRASYGFDRPLPVQLMTYFRKLVQLDFGQSVRGVPVSELIADKLMPTLLLAGLGFIISSIVGIGLGIWSARRPNTASDNLATVASLAGYSLPVFWLGQLMILLFARHLGWLPVQGMRDARDPKTGWADVQDVAKHLVLPVVTFSVYPITLVYRLTRSRVREMLAQDFIVTARAKGMSERRVVYRHAVPNAMLTVTTVLGFNFAFLLAGSALVETVFAWPGMGRLLTDSISSRDYNVLLGLFFVFAVMVVIANVVTDLINGAIDPRTRQRSSR